MSSTPDPSEETEFRLDTPSGHIEGTRQDGQFPFHIWVNEFGQGSGALLTHEQADQLATWLRAQVDLNSF